MEIRDRRTIGQRSRLISGHKTFMSGMNSDLDTAIGRIVIVPRWKNLRIVMSEVPNRPTLWIAYSSSTTLASIFATRFADQSLGVIYVCPWLRPRAQDLLQKSLPLWIANPFVLSIMKPLVRKTLRKHFKSVFEPETTSLAFRNL